MKNKLFLIALSLLFIQCHTDSIPEQESQNLMATMVSSTNEAYVPSQALDTSREGVYHGVIAIKNGAESAKIWVNLNNDNNYSAKIINRDGSEIHFNLDKENSTFDDTLRFVSNQASFTVTYTKTKKGIEFSEAVIAGEPYFIHAPKQTTSRMTFPFVGTYTFLDNGINGTWTVFADMSQPDPNGTFFEGFAMDDVVVTYNGNMFVDNSHEVGPYPCEGVNTWVPTIRITDFGGGQVINEMFVQNQTSIFAGGTTTWKIFQAGGVGYFDENCDDLDSGVFSWVSPNTGLTRTGTILVDINL